jgi:uncharacterized membrane protein
MLILLLALVPILVAFDKISGKTLQLAILVTAIALLFHTSLISMYVWGADIHHEYYFSSLVQNSSFWDSSIADEYNAMLSVSMLPSIISEVCGISLTWVFKIVYPLIFSFVPLVLYQTFRRQTGDKIAFLAVFFFMSVFTFFTEMNSIARQQLAEVFFVLIVLMAINKSVDYRKKTALVVIFGVSLALSHYALTYIFIWSLIVALTLSFFLRKKAVNRFLEEKIFIKKKSHDSVLKYESLTPTNKTFSINIVLLFCVVAFTWYIYIGSSATFNQILHTTGDVLQSALTKFLSPQAYGGLSTLLLKTVSPLHEVTKTLNVLTQIFIGVGVVMLLIGRIEENLDFEYVLLSFVYFLLALAAIAVPALAAALNTTRLYHITLLVLSPFCIMGGVTIFTTLSRILLVKSKKKRPMSKETALKFLSVFLVFFLLFNSGFMYEITKIHPSSIFLSHNYVKVYGSPDEKINFYNAFTLTEEVVSARWLAKQRNHIFRIYSDFGARQNDLNTYALIPRDKVQLIRNTTKVIMDHSYVYIRNLNIDEALMGGGRELDTYKFNATKVIFPLYQKADKIYSNGGSEIYYTNYAVLLYP